MVVWGLVSGLPVLLSICLQENLPEGPLKRVDTCKCKARLPDEGDVCKAFMDQGLPMCSQRIFSKLYFFIIIVVLGAHCDIYKSSYTIL
jgi:hypothetical protein